VKLALRRRRAEPLPGVTGTARVERDRTALAHRVHRGDIVVVDEIDLDRATAEALISRGVGAVVNVPPSTSGRYPNLGPGLLVAAGVPLVDSVGVEVFGRLRDGQPVRVDGPFVYDADGEVIAVGRAHDHDTVAADAAAAAAGLAAQLEAFAADTAEFLRRDPDLLDGADTPELAISFAGRHAVVVVSGPDTAEQLAGLHRYLRERRPVLIGVEKGVSELRAAGLRPDVALVDNPDGLDEDALRSAGEIVARVDPMADPWPLWRVQDLGLPAHLFRTAAAAEDAALLLADRGGAEVIVTVGLRTDLVGTLDRGRGRLASSFLTRLRAGARTVDARAALLLYGPRLSRCWLFALLLAGLGALFAAVAISPAEPIYAHWLSGHWQHLARWVHRRLR
jgi:uncharacterized membrane-anchored protein